MPRYLDYEGRKKLRAWIRGNFLGKGARAADAALLGGKPPEYYAGPPVNLLVNSYFEIAQAGYGGMHGGDRYAADRWQNLYQFGTFASANPGIVMTYETNHAYAVQKIANSERYVGKMLTFGVMTDEYGLLLCTGLYTGTTLVAHCLTDTCETTIVDGCVRVIAISGTLTVRWAALYEGVYTADTFPTPAPCPYSVELAECQRYYYEVDNVHFDVSPYHRELPIIYPVPMRIPSPTVAVTAQYYTGVWVDVPSASITTTDSNASAARIRIDGIDTTPVVRVSLSASADL